MSANVGLFLAGLWQRRWLSLLVLTVAVVGAAAASMGPPYAEAARTAIVRDAFRDAPSSARGLMVTYAPDPQLRVDESLIEEATGIPPAFSTISGAELYSSLVKDPINEIGVIWRDGACRHLRLVDGRCPSDVAEVVGSRITAEHYGWVIGDKLLIQALDQPRKRTPLTLTGLYEPRNPDEPYWLGLPYFPDTTGATAIDLEDRLFDPLFTPEETFTSTRGGQVRWLTTTTLLVDLDRVSGSDAEALEDAVPRTRERMVEAPRDPDVSPPIVFSDMERLAGRAVRAQATLGVPIAVVVIQLVVLSWLVLFFGIVDLVQARRTEFGLARLRGVTRPGMWRLALGETTVLLLAAIPIGVLVGRFATSAITRALFSHDIPIESGSGAWAAAAASVAGGLIAAGFAANSIALAPVGTLLRRSRTHASDRSWIPDVVALCLIAIGLFQLTSREPIGSFRSDATSLLLPGLITLAAALLISRLLPWAAHAAYRRSKGKSVGRYLAARQLARSPQTPSAVIVIVAAFGLATFAVSAWSVAQRNQLAVARAQNGAATVFVVQPPEEMSVVDLVDEIDPEGRSAAGVAVFESSTRMLAVDTERLERVAYWGDDFADRPFSELLERIRPPTAPPVELSGQMLRVDVDASRVGVDNITLSATLEFPNRLTPVDLVLRPTSGRTGIYEARISRDCRPSCELRALKVRSSSTVPQTAQTEELLFRSLEVRDENGWTEVDAGLDDAARWRAHVPAGQLEAGIAGSDKGLTLTFLSSVETDAVVATHPAALPALTVGSVAPDPGGNDVHGLDSQEMLVGSVGRVDGLPGADGPTAMVDHGLAEAVAYGTIPTVEHQVWAAPGAADRVRKALREQGVAVPVERTVPQLVAAFERQGPGLAMRLLLAASVAAAFLALARGVYGLYATRRRRTYEFAALSVLGVSRRTQKATLLLEQAVTLGTGAIAGAAAGMIAAAVAVPRIPQFAIRPITPPITNSPDMGLVLAVVAVSMVAVALASILSSQALFRHLRMEQLREAPP